MADKQYHLGLLDDIKDPAAPTGNDRKEQGAFNDFKPNPTSGQQGSVSGILDNNINK
jgi:hypothetical protein